jgi:hypothetical protein
MARVGAVVKLASVTAPGLSVREVKAEKFGFNDSAGDVQRYLQMDGSSVIYASNSADTEGRYFKNDSLEQIDTDAIAADAVTAAKLGLVAFHAYLDSDSAQANGTLILHDKEFYDVGGGFNTSTGVFTATAAGLHVFSAGVQVNGLDPGDSAGVLLYINSAPRFASGNGRAHTAGDNVAACGTWPIVLSANDTVHTVVYYNYSGGGGDRTLLGEASSFAMTFFSGVQLG